MSNRNKSTVHPKWVDAIALGTVWGAFEIVFGSLLHNLRIPFSGNLLTAGSLILLISAAHLHSGRGLFFRSAIICAALKTLSPSAIIFGPMVAILAQGIILETSVLLLKRSVPAFLLASVLAMSWNLVQKILNYLIYYGNTLAEMYSNLMEYARLQLSIKTELVWLPLLILLILYAAFGFLAGLTGIRIGKQIKFQESTLIADINTREGSTDFKQKDFPYSIGFLIINTLTIILAFYFMRQFHFNIWSLPVLLIIILWSVRYRRALRQLGKPKLWITFLLITILSTVVFNLLPGSNTSLKESIFIGLAMNERAIFFILALTVTGTELYNPRLWKMKNKGSLFRLAKGVNTARGNLPVIMQNIPAAEQIRKQPGKLISSLLRLSMDLNNLSSNGSQLKQSLVTILTGTKGSGKTSFLAEFTEKLSANGWSIAGIIAPRMSDKNSSSGYLIKNLQNGKEHPFLRKQTAAKKTTVGKYQMYNKGYRAGLRALREAIQEEPDLLVIDEIGPLELKDKGWAPMLNYLLENTNISLLLVVRESLVKEVKQKWGNANYRTLSLEEARSKNSDILRRELMH